MYTGLLDHPEFQFTDSDGGVHDISGWESEANEIDPWDTALDAILWSASGQRSEEDLSWALVDKTA